MTQRLFRLENNLGTTYNECSIAAADACRVAEETMANADYVQRKHLLVVDENLAEPTDVQCDVVLLSDRFNLEIEGQEKPGHPVQAALIKRIDASGVAARLELAAIARGKIAFPVASFTRRSGEFCDFVQLGQEMDGSDFVVTRNDEMSRKAVIENIRLMLTYNPLVLIHKELLEADFDKEVADFLSKQYLYKRNGAFKRYSEDKEYMPGRKLIQLAYGRELAFPYGLQPQQTHGVDALDAEMKDVVDISLDDIKTGKAFKTIEENTGLRGLLLQYALRQKIKYSNSGQTTQEDVQVATNNALISLGVNARINQMLGDHSESLELLIAKTRALALAGVALKQTIKGLRISSTNADTDVEIRAVELTDKVDTYRLDTTAVPVALRGKVVPVKDSLYVFSSGLNGIEPEDIEETLALLKMVEKPVIVPEKVNLLKQFRYEVNDYEE